MAASASMPPTPQPSTPRPFTMVVWESVPTRVSRIGLAVVGGEDHPGQVLQVDLVADAGPRRHDPEPVEGLLRPAQAAGSARCCAGTRCPRCGRRTRRPERSAMTEWSMTSSTGTSGLIRRVAAELRERVAHGGQVDHAGHAGEVLHEDPLGGEGDLRRLAARPWPGSPPTRPGPRCRRRAPARRPRGAAGSPAAPSWSTGAGPTSKRPARASSRWISRARPPTESSPRAPKEWVTEDERGAVPWTCRCRPELGGRSPPGAHGTPLSGGVAGSARTANGASTIRRPRVQASACSTD